MTHRLSNTPQIWGRLRERDLGRSTVCWQGGVPLENAKEMNTAAFQGLEGGNSTKNRSPKGWGRGKTRRIGKCRLLNREDKRLSWTEGLGVSNIRKVGQVFDRGVQHVRSEKRLRM